MKILKKSEISIIQGNEGSEIKQYFNPDNTVNGINYSIAQFTIESGKKSKIHKITSSEIYYILEGRGNITIEGTTYLLEKDDSVFIQPNSEQFIKNTGKNNLKFLCIVEPAWKIGNEEVLE